MVTINIYTSGTTQQVDASGMSQSGGAAPSPDPNMGAQSGTGANWGYGGEAPHPTGNMFDGSGNLSGESTEAPSPQTDFNSLYSDADSAPSPSGSLDTNSLYGDAPRPTRQPEEGNREDKGEVPEPFNDSTHPDSQSPEGAQEENKSKIGEEKQSRKR